MIKICLKKADALGDALNEANGRATANTYVSWFQLVSLAEIAECKLGEAGLPKGKRAGAILVAQSGHRPAKAYQHLMRTTTVKLLRKSSDWYLVHALQSSLKPGEKPAWRLGLSVEQDKIICRKVRERIGYNVLVTR